MKKILLHKISLLIFVFFPCVTFAQIIWSEDFSSYAEGTTVGANNNTENSAPDWTISGDLSTNNNGYFQVENQSFEGYNTGVYMIWTSETIDISSHEFVQVYMVYGYVLGNGRNSSDDMHIEYNIDDLGWTSFPIGRLRGRDFDSDITGKASTEIIQGKSLSIRVKLNVYSRRSSIASNAIWLFDNITVYTVKKCNPCYSVESGDIKHPAVWSNTSKGNFGFIPTMGADLIIEGEDTVNITESYNIRDLRIKENSALISNYRVQLNFVGDKTRQNIISVEQGSKMDLKNSFLIFNNISNYNFHIDGEVDIYSLRTNKNSTLLIDGIGALSTTYFHLSGDYTMVKNYVNLVVLKDLGIASEKNTLENHKLINVGEVGFGYDLRYSWYSGYGKTSVHSARNQILNHGHMNIQNTVYNTTTYNCAIYNFGTINISNDLEYLRDGSDVPRYSKTYNYGTMTIENNLQLRRDHDQFHNYGNLTINNDLFFDDVADSSSFISYPNSITNIQGKIHTIEFLGSNPALNSIHNAGQFSVTSGIENNGDYFNIVNDSTGKMTFDGNILNNSNYFNILNNGEIITTEIQSSGKQFNIINDSLGKVNTQDIKLNDSISQMYITNTGNLTFNNILASNSDLDITNTGIIHQFGTFIDIDSLSLFKNSTNGYWNYHGNSHDIDTKLDCSDSGNVFSYAATTDQNMIEVIGNNYYHLNITSGGTKQAVDSMNIKGNLEIKNNAILNLGNHNISIEGDWINLSNNPTIMDHENHKVTFTGLTEQKIISPNISEQFHHIIMDKLYDPSECIHYSDCNYDLIIDDNIEITGDLTNLSKYYIVATDTTTITFNGGNNQKIVATSDSTYQTFYNFLIDKPDNSFLTLHSDIRIRGNWTNLSNHAVIPLENQEVEFENYDIDQTITSPNISEQFYHLAAYKGYDSKLTLNNDISILGNYRPNYNITLAENQTITFNGTKDQNITAGHTLFNNLLIDKPSGIFNVSSTRIEIKGNWTNLSNNPILVSHNSYVEFNGTENQIISAPNTVENFYYLNISKSNGTLVTLDGGIDVDILLFNGESGYLVLNQNTLNINRLIGSRDPNQFVVVDKESHIQYKNISDGDGVWIPMGLSPNPKSYSPIKLEMIDAGDGTLTATMCEQVQKDGGLCTGTATFKNVVGQTWDITSTSKDAYIQLFWTADQEKEGFNRNECSVVHFDGNEWENLGFSNASKSQNDVYNYTNTPLYVQSGWTTGFSPFSVQDNNQILPVSLLDFEVIKQNEEVLINWTTLSEINNDFFTVERSINGIHFEEIAIVKGAGNSNELNFYEVIDTPLQEGIYYYRIKQTDYDGTFEIFSMKKVTIEKAFALTIYPNPTLGGSIFIQTSQNNQNFEIRIFNDIGQEISITKEMISQNTIKLNFNDILSTGLYLVNIYKEGEIIKKPFIVQ